jgi:hypothetical protein
MTANNNVAIAERYVTKLLSRKAFGKPSAVVPRIGKAVTSITSPQFVRTTDIQVFFELGEEIDAGSRQGFWQTAVIDRRHRQQLVQLLVKPVCERRKIAVHFVGRLI